MSFCALTWLHRLCVHIWMYNLHLNRYIVSFNDIQFLILTCKIFGNALNRIYYVSPTGKLTKVFNYWYFWSLLILRQTVLQTSLNMIWMCNFMSNISGNVLKKFSTFSYFDHMIESFVEKCPSCYSNQKQIYTPRKSKKCKNEFSTIFEHS